MVEKIREPYQRHTRNISSVSDISTTGTVEPLKRDENAEIKCVVLCDSETERHCVFEAFQKALVDGQSDIFDAQLLHHHWEQPHNECSGLECRFCLKSSGGMVNLAIPGSGPNGDGFFRFRIGSTIFRLMLLSKDRQNLLKIVSFDFLMVGMQVMDIRGSFDANIWEFEWKRLERLSKKAVAPIILLGYFRDILKLGGSFSDVDKTVDEAKGRIKKIGKSHRVFPRFVDFVTGDSLQISELFRNVEMLYREPGYVLQQCAHNNNLAHFTKIVENPGITEADLCYPEEATGNNPIVIAAKLRHKDLVSSILRSNKFEGSDNQFLADLIHSRNLSGDTLLHTVALQGPELEEQKLLILRKEIQIHCVSEITHEADQLKLQRCLRTQLKSSSEAAIILEQSRALQGIPKTDNELKAERSKVWSKLFFASLLLSLVFNAIDTGSDILIMVRYYGELVGKNLVEGNNTCFNERESFDSQAVCFNHSTADDLISIQCFPIALSPESKFGYTLFFLLVPWPFFIYEFFTSRHYHHLVTKAGEIIRDMAQCDRGLVHFTKAYLKAILYCISFVSCLLFWPIAVLFIKYYNDGKYYLAKGEQKAAREKKIEASEVLWSTARVMEVSLESSFQPTIQLYILFPSLIKTMTAPTFSLKLFTFCKKESFNFKPDQTISIVTSILSLAWCFTSYHATLKRGALDKDLAALFYRAVLFLSVLFQILGRLFILVLFSFSFGPGMYFPLLIFLAAHICLMTVLHFVFSDAKVYWQKGGFLNLSFFHYMVGNGLANIYIHNWIRMDPLLIPFTKPLQHVSTLIRQLLFDLVFVLENVILLAVALSSPVKELQENRYSFAVVLLGFNLVGLVLKAVYYRYLHIWAWLIMDYITKKEDGHWKCLLYSNMYFCGELRERELLLCCIPRPLFRLFNYLCGDRYFASTDTSCSRCTAMFTIFLIPLAFFLSLVALTVVIVLAVAFLPVFILAILPCVVFVRTRRCQNKETVIKVEQQQQQQHFAQNGKEEEEIPLTEKENGDLKNEHDQEEGKREGEQVEEAEEV